MSVPEALPGPPEDPNLVGVGGTDRNGLYGSCLGVGKTKGAKSHTEPTHLGEAAAALNSSLLTGTKDERTQWSLLDSSQRCLSVLCLTPHKALSCPLRGVRFSKAKRLGVETGRVSEAGLRA